MKRHCFTDYGAGGDLIAVLLGNGDDWQLLVTVQRAQFRSPIGESSIKPCFSTRSVIASSCIGLAGTCLWLLFVTIKTAFASTKRINGV